MTAALCDLLVAAFMLAFTVFPTVRIDEVAASDPRLGVGVHGERMGVTTVDADGIPHIYLVDWDTLPPNHDLAEFTNQGITIVHEVLHVADLADNGRHDGSLDYRECVDVPYEPYGCAHRWIAWALANPYPATQMLNAARP